MVLEGTSKSHRTQAEANHQCAKAWYGPHLNGQGLSSQKQTIREPKPGTIHFSRLDLDHLDVYEDCGSTASRKQSTKLLSSRYPTL
ncbi:hypothetical protein GOBAR_AA29108 [Gossypium barbadense]|uniref:Uncharacterized protein n=1 Tax=Gossypium barbadense TaxID=3634 RepID=A0A2P5WKG1_GOSBA|nr:hypothetical protein GOBAR_AA29108 [Gossypium barbadense]